MYSQVGATAVDARRLLSTDRFVRGAWTLDAIAERDRRDFEESLKAQVDRLNRTTNVRRD